jgi:hypothetical protein
MTATSRPVELRAIATALRAHVYGCDDVHLGEVVDLHKSNVGRRKAALTDGEAPEIWDAFTSRMLFRLAIDCPEALDAMTVLATPAVGEIRADQAESNVREAMRRSLVVVQEGVDALAQDGLSPTEAADIAHRLRLLRQSLPQWLANLDARAAQGARP